MIDFRRHEDSPSPAEFLSQFRDRERVLSSAAFAVLAERLQSHRGEAQDFVAELCRWDTESSSNFLRGCLASGQIEALNLAEKFLLERGLLGLGIWLEESLADTTSARFLVDLLADLHEDESSRLLLVLLDHAQFSIRRRAADGLASHRSHSDLRSVIRHLARPLVRGEDTPDPLQAIRALQRLADVSLEPSFGKDIARRAERVLINCVRHDTRRGVRGDAIAALGEIGSRRAVRCLVDMLHREESSYHREVVIALRKIHPDRALIALLSLLQSPDPIIREEAASALGEIGDPKAVARLRELITDANPDVRQEAVLALGKLGKQGGMQVLRALEHALADPVASVRTMACHALAETLGSGAQGKLIGALYDASADVRSEAAYQLGNMGDDNARPHLEEAVRDSSKDAFGDRVGSIARKSLHRLQRKASE